MNGSDLATLSATELLPWHADLWQRLDHLVTIGRLPHALLLCGINGLGKRHFAERFAQRLFCLKQTARPCGVCVGCKQYTARSHPDFRLLEPLENKPIRVDQVRELSGFLQHSQQAGRYKVALLAAAERMNVNAANSLLKTLEEPPGKSVLILLTAWPGRLPATVRSRCQRLNFTVPEASQSHAWLIKQQIVDDSELLLAMAQGAPLAALQLQGQLELRNQLIKHYIELIKHNQSATKLSEQWTQTDLKQTLPWLIGWLMDMIRCQLLKSEQQMACHIENIDLASDFKVLCQPFSAQQLFKLLDMAHELLKLADSQVNMQLQLEAFFLAHHSVH